MASVELACGQRQIMSPSCNRQNLLTSRGKSGKNPPDWLHYAAQSLTDAIIFIMHLTAAGNACTDRRCSCKEHDPQKM